MSNHLNRYRFIAETFSRHGLAFLLGVSGIQKWLPTTPENAPELTARVTPPEHVRLALEELGPVFVKLGQTLSTRPDLVPPAYQLELAKLQDSAPAVSADVIEDLIRQELGKGTAELFAVFDRVPLASASIGQAHAASLADGSELVVKVRRPGVVVQVEEDLEILQNLAVQAGRHWEAAADYDLPGIASEFAQTLRAELDYLQEGRNAERFARNFADDAGINIPAIFWDTTTTRVLTMERIRGIKVNDLPALDAAGIDRRELATRAAGTAAKMIFDDGFFHADPHPGNLFIRPGGTIGLIDFGMVGNVDAELREQLGNLLEALVSKDADKVANALQAMTARRSATDPALLKADLIPVIRLYADCGLAEIPVGRVITEALAILRRHHLQLPREMALLMKMIVMTEGMGVLLDPGFKLAEALEPHIQRLALERFSPAALARRLGMAGSEAVQLGLELPQQLRRFFSLVDRTGVEVHLRAAELEPLVARLERMGNRVVVAMIAAALIRGVGEISTGDSLRWQKWQGPLIGSGLGAVGSLGTYLAWTARRRRRSP
ncbi:ABC1 kinase family protein [Arthrobacter sp. A5]|uniref:ABC1 kinase family protein n=1 Tax=Arthrobacter sp. A5 TaxID=576926 RepID=UPI003DA94DB2